MEEIQKKQRRRLFLSEFAKLSDEEQDKYLEDVRDGKVNMCEMWS